MITTKLGSLLELGSLLGGAVVTYCPKCRVVYYGKDNCPCDEKEEIIEG